MGVIFGVLSERSMAKNTVGAGLEQTLWLSADKLQKNIDAAFKNNDQLKTNTSLQMESAKIEFKVI